MVRLMISAHSDDRCMASASAAGMSCSTMSAGPGAVAAGVWSTLGFFGEGAGKATGA